MSNAHARAEPLLPERIKVNLEHERINRGCSRREMARRTGLNPETIRKAEQGESVSPASAARIAKFFHVEPRDIWPLEATIGRVA